MMMQSYERHRLMHRRHREADAHSYASDIFPHPLLVGSRLLDHRLLLLRQRNTRPPLRLVQRGLPIALPPPLPRLGGREPVRGAVQPVERAHGAKVARCPRAERPLVVQVVLARVVPHGPVPRMRHDRGRRRRDDPHVERHEVRAPGALDAGGSRQRLRRHRAEQRREQVEGHLLPTEQYHAAMPMLALHRWRRRCDCLNVLCRSV